jgi:CubicO group peptidase (beta-lactamase class C family)
MIPSPSSFLLRPSSLRLLLLLGALSAAGCAGSYEPTTADTIPDEVQATIRDAVDQQHRTGVFVGLVNDQGVHVFSYPSTPTSTLYGIGSLTKVFTALCLADLVDQGELDLDSPVNRYLPEDMQIPSRDGTDLTLLHLATHTSGLPKEPSDWDWTSPESPDQIIRFSQDYEYPGPYGSRYVYSNLTLGSTASTTTTSSGSTSGTAGSSTWRRRPPARWCERRRSTPPA